MASNRYINRELSWIKFNERVLWQASNRKSPILERVKFAAIFESNFDEFFMVRVSGLIEQEEAEIEETSPDGLTPSQQLDLIAHEAAALREKALEVYQGSLIPSLRRAGVRLAKWGDIDPPAKQVLSSYFEAEIFPICTPLALHPCPTFPFISNASLNLLVELEDGDERRLGRVKVPGGMPRCLPVPGRRNTFILLEEVIKAHLPSLYPGMKVKGGHLFRVIRDADVEIRELEASDLITAVEQTLRLRRMGAPVMLEAQSSIPEECLSILKEGLELDDRFVMRVPGQLGMSFLWELTGLDMPEHKLPAQHPFRTVSLENSSSLFEQIRRGPILLHMPYDSFNPIQTMVDSAVHDPHVISIKQTLYRVGSSSPIVESLLAAANQGRQVAVMVELKARFDENNNLVWAKALERAGAHVAYGFAQMKTHCKLLQVVRREPEGIRRYTHIGTGNYNPATARLYTDLALLTDDPEISQDVSELFNYLTGFSKQTRFRKLLIAPLSLREGIIERIRREAALARKSGEGRLIFKLNSLVDPEVIDALYEASESGVEIDLIVRGICCLRPGVKGLSSRIRVVSIIGRFLEHSRIYWFKNGGAEEAFIGSADMMRRNLDRRVEVLAPVESKDLIDLLVKEALLPALRDTDGAWELSSGGRYRRLRPKPGDRSFSSQEAMALRPLAAMQGHLDAVE